MATQVIMSAGLCSSDRSSFNPSPSKHRLQSSPHQSRSLDGSSRPPLVSSHSRSSSREILSRSPQKAFSALGDCFGRSPPKETEHKAARPKSLYRQPAVCSQVLRGRSNSCVTSNNHLLSDTRFSSHFLSANRRRLHELWQASVSDTAINDNGGPSSPSKQSTYANTLSVNEDDFRPRAKSAGAQYSILKREDLLRRIAASRKKSPKHTTFRDEVDVYYYDDKARTTHSPGPVSQKLKDNEILTTVLNSADPNGDRDINKCGENVNGGEAIDSKGNGSMTKDKIFSGLQIQVVHSKSVSQADSLRISLQVNDECVKNKTSVKAMSGGHSLIVIVYKEEQIDDKRKVDENIGSYDDNDKCQTKDTIHKVPQINDKHVQSDSKETHSKSKLHQYIEKIALPKEVDPYGVRAFVYKNGSLVIEAPLVK